MRKYLTILLLGCSLYGMALVGPSGMHRLRHNASLNRNMPGQHTCQQPHK